MTKQESGPEKTVEQVLAMPIAELKTLYLPDTTRLLSFSEADFVIHYVGFVTSVAEHLEEELSKPCEWFELKIYWEGMIRISSPHGTRIVATAEGQKLRTEIANRIREKYNSIVTQARESQDAGFEEQLRNAGLTD